MKKIQSILSLCTILFFASAGNAQETTYSLSDILQNMYRNYDSVTYLSFDVFFHYSSDTIYGKFESEQLQAHYTMAGKKARYSIGDVEFMQNDSFFIAVYDRDKIIVVDEPKMPNAGGQLPMRAQLDSLLNSYAAHYSLSMTTLGSDTAVLTFSRADSVAQYDRFSLSYDDRDYRIYRLFYEFPAPADLDTALLASLREKMGADYVPMQKKRLSIRFKNYRLDNYDEELYDENKYIWFENGVCKPVSRYADFQVYYTKPTTQFNETQDNSGATSGGQ